MNACTSASNSARVVCDAPGRAVYSTLQPAAAARAHIHATATANAEPKRLETMGRFDDARVAARRACRPATEKLAALDAHRRRVCPGGRNTTFPKQPAHGRSRLLVPQTLEASAGSRALCDAQAAQELRNKDAHAATRRADRPQWSQATRRRQRARSPVKAAASHNACPTRESWTAVCGAASSGGATCRRAQATQLVNCISIMQGQASTGRNNHTRAL